MKTKTMAFQRKTHIRSKIVIDNKIMESIKYGLVINEKKTKYMKCTRRKQSEIEGLEIRNLKTGQVKSFRFLVTDFHKTSNEYHANDN
jgi:hypothetical protein